MSTKLTFISAGAGSGKTHELTRILYEELAAKRVEPSGVIATTFTRKAATELRERVRGFLLQKGEFSLANAMGQARIGTVNAVCGELLQRFAFEAGLPTEQTVLEEEQATILLKQAIDLVQDGDDAAELRQLCTRLSIDNFDEDFKNLVATVRANDISPADLAVIARENADDLLAHFPTPTSEPLADDLLAALEFAIPAIRAGAGAVKTTAIYLDAAEALRRGLNYGDARWADWIKISKMAPAAALKNLAQQVAEISARAPESRELQSDLRSYLKHLFDLCARVLDVYAQIKLERGVIDFTDQERLLLKLLDNLFVAETLRDELDLLMVDEFQDTSPIQLALFLRLTQFAKQVYWVGDIKQAIYGFRGSDTVLMESILRDLEALGGTRETLDQSWRSRKPLVDIINAVFVPAFSDTMKAEDVALNAQRSQEWDDPPFAHWRLPGNVEQQIAWLGQALRQVVASGYIVYDKPAERFRPITYGDIAILRRSNESVTKTAIGLRGAGVAAMTEQPGLLATPEAILALACLRRLNDARDTIASAEIISLSECSEPEDWVIDRLAYVATDSDSAKWREVGANSNPILSRIAQLRDDMPVMAPAEALETAIAECQLPSVVLRWNGSADIGRVRLANLDALIAMARQYESACSGAKQAASVSGLLLWLNEQASNDGDSLALPAIDAVQVMTHHNAKGLEWPVVVLMDLHGEIKDGLWNSLRGGSRGKIDAADPLRDRTLRIWPWPFGLQKKFPFNDELARTPIAQEYQRIAIEEAKRLLYVSMTRARDLMILAIPGKNSDSPWLDTLNAPWLTDIKDCRITLPTEETVPVLSSPEPVETDVIELADQLWWYREPTEHLERLPRIFNPSKAESPPMAVLETVRLGERLTIGANADWTTVGHAVHAGMALAFVDLSREIQTQDVQNILTSYQLTAHVSALALADQIRVVTRWVRERWPGCKILPEWPVEARLESGQVLNGRIDLMIDAGDHWVLLDYKSNPGGQRNWPELANTHGGQLLAYQRAVELATGKSVKEIWLVLPVAAGGIRIERV